MAPEAQNGFLKGQDDLIKYQSLGQVGIEERHFIASESSHPLLPGNIGSDVQSLTSLSHVPQDPGTPLSGAGPFPDDHDTRMGRGLRSTSNVYAERSGFENRHARNQFTAPALSVDTGGSTSNSQETAPEASLSPLSPVSPRSPLSSASRLPPMRSPTSLRNRDRAFSLRRSLLVRNVHGLANDESAIELQPTGQSSIQPYEQLAAIDDRPAKEPNTSTIACQAVDDVHTLEPQAQPKEKQPSSLSLPHYETWMDSRTPSAGIWTRLQAAKRKFQKRLLRIQEIPPSKDGRHLGLNKTKPLIDERTSREYVRNTIRSSRYTLYNFLPRQLYAQFSKLANFYFLCVSILQMIPGLSTTGTYTTIVPLAFFVTVSMAKEGYDDLRRYRLDKGENKKSTFVRKPRHATAGPTNDGKSSTTCLAEVAESWNEIRWEDVQVGDIVRLARDEAAPADVVVLQAKGTDELAYIETMALDGETNLKSRRPVPLLGKTCSTLNEISDCGAQIVVEDPNLDLYNFEGRLTIGDETMPLTNTEVVYRGSILRNTSEITALVVYTGEECKIRMNATKNPRIKAPSLQAVVNKVVIILVIFVVVLAIFNTIAYQIWQETTEEKAWYLSNASVAFFPILVSFIILFNTMIPLSLYVSLEIVKLFQLFLMKDIEMFDEDSNTPMEARTSTINEELGQVKWVFSQTL